MEAEVPIPGDLSEVARQLIDDFPTVDARDVLDALRLSREAVELVGLRSDAWRTAEVITRYRLRLRTGQAVDGARLDPERHPPRTRR